MRDSQHLRALALVTAGDRGKPDLARQFLANVIDEDGKVALAVELIATVTPVAS